MLRIQNSNSCAANAIPGLFKESHMTYDVERNRDVEPSLSDMTKKAIQVLQKNDNGFFLMVEGMRCIYITCYTYYCTSTRELHSFPETTSVTLNIYIHTQSDICCFIIYIHRIWQLSYNLHSQETSTTLLMCDNMNNI